MFKYLLIALMLLFSTTSFAQTNSVYIDQVGSTNTLSITQAGSGNRIGSSLTPSTIL